jgi:hypothetical protein
MWSFQVSYRAFCVVIVGLMMVATLFGCQHQDQTYRTPQTFQEFQKLRNYRTLEFHDYLRAFALAKSPDQQWWTLQGMAKTVTNTTENVSLRECIVESALASQADKVADLNQTIVENCGNYPVVRAAYDALPEQKKAEAFPSLVWSIQHDDSWSSSRLDIALEVLQEAMRLHMDSEIVNNILFASQVGTYASASEALRRLTFGSPAWNALLDYLWDRTANEPGGLVAYYNEAEPKVQRVIYTTAMRRPDRANWNYICEHAKPGTPLRNHALRQVTQGLTLDKALANYHAAETPNLRQILAAQIDTICQTGGDSDDNWQKVLEGTKPHTYLGIMAEERMRDIVARRTGRAALEQSQPETAPIPRTNPSIWGEVQSVYYPDTPSEIAPPNWGMIKANYR